MKTINTTGMRLVFIKPVKVECISFDSDGNEVEVKEKEFFSQEGISGHGFRDKDEEGLPIWHIETPLTTMIVPANVVKTMKLSPTVTQKTN